MAAPLLRQASAAMAKGGVGGGFFSTSSLVVKLLFTKQERQVRFLLGARLMVDLCKT